MWSFHAETSRWPSGWNTSTQMFESCAWDGVARRRICGAGANSAGAGRDAGEVVTAGVDDDEAELVWASLLFLYVHTGQPFLHGMDIEHSYRLVKRCTSGSWVKREGGRKGGRSISRSSSVEAARRSRAGFYLRSTSMAVWRPHSALDSPVVRARRLEVTRTRVPLRVAYRVGRAPHPAGPCHWYPLVQGFKFKNTILYDTLICI